MKFPHYKQLEQRDCGPTCIKIIAKYFGRVISISQIRQLSETTRSGSSLLGLSDAAESLGLHSRGVKLSFNKLKNDVALPCVAHWGQNHFVVIYKIKRNHIYISDPGRGKLKLRTDEFLAGWVGPNSALEDKDGIVLLLEPSNKFFQKEGDPENTNDLLFLFQYVLKYKPFLIQLFLGVVVASLLQLIFPFLTQSIIDVGIQNQDMNFIYIVLLAQLFLFIGRTTIELTRAWIMLHLSTRINISLVSDFFIKLMKLPISYFDTKMTGDIMLKIADHKRIQTFLTDTSLNVIFAFFNLVIFSLVLGWYNSTILLMFVVGSISYVGWILIFQARRKKIDQLRFRTSSRESSKVIELVNGMQEIKLYNAERIKRWGWENIQAQLFTIEKKHLAIETGQLSGSAFINEIKNILITVFSASLVVSGQLTLGMLLAISYILGQLNSPLSQLVNFIHNFQDARISLERLLEVHNLEDESHLEHSKISNLPNKYSIELTDVTFRYSKYSAPVLNSLNLLIPQKKITAIVGSSGSGKTTLMKVILQFYKPESGVIKLGSNHLGNVQESAYREICGTVMQEGYLFNDTIANNIAVKDNANINWQKLFEACEMANISEFIESLPEGYSSMVGMEGLGISTGQRQRIMIARAIYKNPKILFFDEATSSLDATNEAIIDKNLESFIKQRTTVIIAHRLSTVKNADQIVVMSEGRIVEVGNHSQLIEFEGAYFDLVKNQLELDRSKSNGTAIINS